LMDSPPRPGKPASPLTRRVQSNSKEIEDASPVHPREVESQELPSPRRQRLEVRHQQKQSVSSSSTLTFTSLCVCDTAMFRACQDGKKKKASAVTAACATPFSLGLAGLGDENETPPPLREGGGSASEPRSGPSEEIRSFKIMGVPQPKDPRRPQSSRGGRSSSKCFSINSRNMSNNSLFSLFKHPLSGTSSTRPLETPPGAHDAFEIRPIQPRVAERTRAVATLRPEAKRRRFESLLSCHSG